MRHSPSTKPSGQSASRAQNSRAVPPEDSAPPPTKLNLNDGDWTPTPNLYFQWASKLDLIEIRIVSLFVRSTFGWQRERCVFSVDEIMNHVDRSKPPVIAALARLRAKGILGRSRTSRQEPFEYWLVMRPEFRVVKPRTAPEHLQMPLRYDVHDFSSKESLTTGEVTKPLPLSGKESLTTERPVLIVDLKKEKPLNTHTHSTPSELELTEVGRVAGSRFDKKIIKQYARQISSIKDPVAWATVALRTGEWDDDIQEYFEALERITKREAAQTEKPLAKKTEDHTYEMAINAVELVMTVEKLSLADAIERLRDASPPPETVPESGAWEMLLRSIKIKLGAECFETWFKPIRFDGIDHSSGLIRLDAPNQVVKDWIRVNYSNLMDQSLSEAGLAGYTVYWTVSGVNPAFQSVDEALIQRVIAHFVNEPRLRVHSTHSRMKDVSGHVSRRIGGAPFRLERGKLDRP